MQAIGADTGRYYTEGKPKDKEEEKNKEIKQKTKYERNGTKENVNECKSGKREGERK